MRATFKSMVGIAVCAATAALVSLLLRDGATIRLAAPAISIQVVIVTALFWGRWPALIGAVVAGLTFKLWLYPPYDSLWIDDPAQRIVLTLFQLTALCVAVLSPPRGASGPTPERSQSFFAAKAFGLSSRVRAGRTSGNDARENNLPPKSR